MATRTKPSSDIVNGRDEAGVRKAAETKPLEQILVVSSFLISLILLLAQTSIGAWRTVRYSTQVSTSILVILALSVLSLLIAPGWSVRVINTVMRAIIEALANVIITVLLAVTYLAFLIPARLWGRKRIKTLHPLSLQWVRDPDAWREHDSTWAAKQSAAQASSARKHKGVLWALVSFFYHQRNWLLLVIVLILAAIASLAFILSSPVAAPFIYPLF